MRRRCNANDAVQSQKAVFAYFTSKQMQPFGSAELMMLTVWLIGGGSQKADILSTDALWRNLSW